MEINVLIKILPTKKNPGPDRFTANFTRLLKKN
jgi:hypothetical protein